MRIFLRRTILLIPFIWALGLLSTCTSRNDARFSGLSDESTAPEPVSLTLSGTIDLASIITRTDILSVDNIITRTDLQAAGITNPVAIPVPDTLSEAVANESKAASVENKPSSNPAIKQTSAADIGDLSQLAIAVYGFDENDAIIGQSFSEETGRFSLEIEASEAVVKVALALPIGTFSVDSIEFASTLFLGFVAGADSLTEIDTSQNADGDNIELGLLSSSESGDIESSADFSDTSFLTASNDEVAAESIDGASKIFSLAFDEDASPFIDAESGISVTTDDASTEIDSGIRGNVLALTGDESASFSPSEYPGFTEAISDQFTLSAWIKVQTWVRVSDDDFSVSVGGSYYFGENPEEITINEDNVRNDFVYLGMEPNSQTLRVYNKPANPDGSNDYTAANLAEGTLALSAGTWHHVAAVMSLSEASGVSIVLYVDGVVDQHATCDCDTSGVFYDFSDGELFSFGTIAQHDGGTTATFAGYLDEVHMYNTALTPGQILTDYLSGLE